MPALDRASRASAATVPPGRGALARWAIGSWVLRIAAALGIDAVVHWQNASAYAEGAAVVLAGLGLMAAVLARRSATAHRELGYGRRPGPTGRGRAPQW